VTVCEALDAHATYLAAHPTMAGYTDALGFATWPFEPVDCGIAVDEQLEMRLAGPVADPPCDPGTEPATHQLREGPSRGCLGGQSVGDGRFQVDDSGRVFDGWWTTEVDGRITHQAHYDSGIQTLGVDWWWRDGVPVLWGWDTFGADGYPATRTEFAQDGRLAWKAWYRPVYDEGRRVTWHRSGASTSVSIAETEEEGQPRVVRERRLTDGVEGPVERWVSGSRSLDRADTFGAWPTRANEDPTCGDPGLVGDDRGAFRYARATVPVPAGVTKVRFPPGWVSIEGAADGAVDLLVQQRRLRSPAGAPIDPCDWTSTGVRLSKAGAEWQLTTFGIGDTETSSTSVTGVIVLPKGLTARLSEGLYARSEQATADADAVELRSDPGRLAEVFGPWLAQENPESFRRESGRLVYDWYGAWPIGDISPQAGEEGVFVDTARQDVADGILADLRTAAPTVEACFGPILKVAPEVRGTVSAYFSVRPDGTVGFARQLRGWSENLPYDRVPVKPLVDPAGRCVEAALRAIHFTPREDREVAVQATISLPTTGSQLGIPRP
jgi:hypothetical protein